jgi:hypothetical protein
MAVVTAILGALPVLLKVILMIMEGLKKSPSEDRRKDLAELDQAFKNIKENKDLTELSKWLGRRL